MKAAERTLFMIRQAATATSTLQCYQSLAAGAFTGGQGVDGGTSLGAQIVGLVQDAASKIAKVTYSVSNADYSFDAKTPIADVRTPLTRTFDGALTSDGVATSLRVAVRRTSRSRHSPTASRERLRPWR